MKFSWSIQSSHGVARSRMSCVAGALLSLCFQAASEFAVADDLALLDETPVPGPQAEPVNAESGVNEEDIGSEPAGKTIGKVLTDSYGHEYFENPTGLFVGPPKPDNTDALRDVVKKKEPVIAANIDLSAPVAPTLDVDGIDIGMIAPPVEPILAEYPQKSLHILGVEVAASTATRLAWSPDHSFAGIAAPTPVLVVNGAKPGPVLCITAAIHGDELNGIEVVRRVLYELEPEKLSGTVIGVPIVNLLGFHRVSRYLPDRRDLNRYFPGNPYGSAASRLAHSFFTEIISHCDALVDLHTGSFQRTNLPQLRADLKNPHILELTQGFGSTVVLHGRGAEGTLRRAAADAGIPAVTLEAGEPVRVQDSEVTHSAKGVMTLLNQLGMYRKTTSWGKREPIYYQSKWVRAESGGVLFSKIGLGDRVRKNELLGTITDPITNMQTELRAVADGRILGMALDQFVMPGFAAYRIGIEKPDAESLASTPDNESDDGDGSDHSDSGSTTSVLDEAELGMDEATEDGSRERD